MFSSSIAKAAISRWPRSARQAADVARPGRAWWAAAELAQSGGQGSRVLALLAADAPYVACSSGPSVPAPSAAP